MQQKLTIAQAIQNNSWDNVIDKKVNMTSQSMFMNANNNSLTFKRLAIIAQPQLIFFNF